MKPETRIRLVFIDADGTLVGKRGVPECAWEAIERARARGVRFSLSTGRLARGETLAYARRLDPSGLHIFHSGAAVVTGEGEVVQDWPLSPTVYHRTVDFARARGLLLEAYTSGGDFYTERQSRLHDDHARLLGLASRPADLHAVPLEGRVVRLQFIAEAARWRREKLGLALEEAVLHEATAPATPGVIYASLTAPGVNKRQAAAWVARRLGVRLQTEAAAIGDGLNDLALIQGVALGIAMADAPDEVRRAARLVVPPADACGLAEAIARVLGS